MSTHLTPGQRALMQAALLQRQNAIEQQISQHLGGGSRSEHARDVLLQDGDDAPARDADREVDLALGDQAVGELRAVNEALARLRSATYGLCDDCGAAIPFDRLLNNPQALRCVPCQEAREAHAAPARRATL